MTASAKCSVAFACGSSASRSAGSSPRSISTTWTCADALGEVLGQHAEPAADLEHDVVGAQLRRAADHVEQVRVDQEVLAQLAVRADAERLQAAQARLGREPAHQPNSARGVRLDRLLELLVGDPAPLGDEARGVDDVRGLVALLAHGLRRQVRRVGLDQQAVERDARRGVGEVGAPSGR